MAFDTTGKKGRQKRLTEEEGLEMYGFQKLFVFCSEWSQKI